jgi:hypothetical protein
MGNREWWGTTAVDRSPSELAKIKSAKRHFEAIGIDEYARAAPGSWNL